MTKSEDKERSDIMEMIRDRALSLRHKTITLGFDGFIDTVARVIRHKDDHQAKSYFESSQEFGQYIVEKGEKNFSLELEEFATKLGGNMPITANALSQLGPSVNCIGSLGYPNIHPVFQKMAAN